MHHLLRSFFRFARTLRGIIALGMTSFLLIIGITMAKATAQSTGDVPLSRTAAAQIQALVQEKQSRNPAQQKISSALLYTAKARRGDALLRSVPSLPSFINSNALFKVTPDGKVQVEIKTKSPVTPDLLKQIEATGSQVLSAPSGYNTIVALASLDQLEYLAWFSGIRKISPFIEPRLLRGTSEQEGESITINDLSPASDSQDVSTVEQVEDRLAVLPQFRQLLAQVPGVPITNVGSVTSEGDIAHGAAVARSTYKVDGSWTKKIGTVTQTQRVKIGVLSDSYNNLNGAAADITNKDLPADGVTLVGSGDLKSGGIDEGRAMLQIIHDLVPGAKLYFATAFNSDADFANNIRALRKAGCDIIVDDIIYFREPVFQDGIIAQAVNDVTASGALYFSSAGNEGNKNDGTSGVWEGNFVDGGAAPLGLSGRVHKFSKTALTNSITKQAGPLTLQWSDPWGQSSNDYDLYLLNPRGTEVVLASTDFQSGNGDPFEGLFYSIPSGYEVVVVQSSGQRRYLHLNTQRGQLKINTGGQTWGHSAAEKAFSVAAVKAQGLNTLFTGGAANPVEKFSSDGPRRIFYKADGTPITPGKFLSTGGVVRQKPDIAAADGVKTTLPSGSGLNPFFGTSAAAPHAAAVAALLKSFRPSLTPVQIRKVLTSTALDIEAKGVDQDSGYGIVMANRALQEAAKTSLVTP
jgi:hypothetical protein